MVFVLDNYDSFTYNLVQYLGEMGVDICVKRNDEITVADAKPDYEYRESLQKAKAIFRAVDVAAEHPEWG